MITDQLYAQRLVETARVPATAWSSASPARWPRPPAGPFNLSPGGGSNDVGFGCASPDFLHVQRRGENEITFPGCTDFPYPLVRCPAR